MSKFDKLTLKILRGASDSNINFADLCALLKKLGFQERTRSSHHVFRKEGIEEKINLQEAKRGQAQLSWQEDKE